MTRRDVKSRQGYCPSVCHTGGSVKIFWYKIVAHVLMCRNCSVINNLWLFCVLTDDVHCQCDCWQSWTDEYLTWNPDLHGGITRLNFDTGPDAQIWTPDIIVFSASVYFFIEAAMTKLLWAKLWLTFPRIVDHQTKFWLCSLVHSLWNADARNLIKCKSQGTFGPLAVFCMLI